MANKGKAKDKNKLCHHRRETSSSFQEPGAATTWAVSEHWTAAM